MKLFHFIQAVPCRLRRAEEASFLFWWLEKTIQFDDPITKKVDNLHVGSQVALFK